MESTAYFIKNHLGTLVDVRTPAEFGSGHAKGAINIPLQEIQARLQEIKKMAGPVLLCCASGNRSGQAQRYLAQQGVDCRNAGSWYDVQDVQLQSV
jgi:rhodanese-related sulfurtransferase